MGTGVERSTAGETIDPRDMRAAKKRRASRLPAEPAQLAQSAVDGSANGGDLGVGRKLTKAQRTTLIRVIAVHHYVDTVREVLSDEHPDFPEITDRMIRYYRQQIDADMYGEAILARTQALRSGLANKAVRVRYMIRMLEQWRRVPLVESSRYFNDDGIEVTTYKARADASHEQRELLKQIAMELGQLSSSNAPAGMADALNDEDEAVDQDLRSDLNELLAEMVERDKATEIALQAAIRPEREVPA